LSAWRIAFWRFAGRLQAAARLKFYSFYGEALIAPWVGLACFFSDPYLSFRTGGEKPSVAKQAAEKLTGRGKKCQGTTLVVPQVPQNECGLYMLRKNSFGR
jgi:hypothetical protein